MPIARLLIIGALLAAISCAGGRERPLDDTEVGAEVCGDTVDNDGDGVVDCLDPDCDPWCSGGDGDSDVDGDADGMPSGEAVDLLLVVDSSRSMGEEQELLRGVTEELVFALLGGGPDGEAVTDLHLGVVTTDIGAESFALVTCEDADGDDGVLQAEGLGRGCEPRYRALDCEAGSCPWLSHTEELPDDGTDPANPPIWQDLACIVGVGTDGCGMEQHLESMLRALTTQSLTGRDNDGFLRRDALLAVVFITDEDDCSTAQRELFDPARGDLGPFGLRCALHSEMLHPVSRYTDGLTAVKGGDRERVMVAVVGGVPTDDAWRPGDSVEELGELVVVNPAAPDTLRPVCLGISGEGYAPVRLVEVAYHFGGASAIHSVCSDNWVGIVDSIARRVRERLSEL